MEYIFLRELGAAEQRTHELDSSAVADRVLIDVEDHCGGLPVGRAEDPFLPYTQDGADRTGLGLGLTISRRSVEANHGPLTVRDIPGSGCVFTIDLPHPTLEAARGAGEPTGLG